jgi:hypothetical protein
MTPQTVVSQVQRVVVRRWRSAALVTTAAALAGGGLTLLLADAACNLPATVRLWSGLGLVVASPVLLLVAAARRSPSSDAACRLAEAALGDRDRTLQAALELSARPAGDVLAHAAATRLLAALPTQDLPRRLPAAQIALGVSGFVLVGLIGLAGQLYDARLWPQTVVRFTDPHGDHPPFSRAVVQWAVAPTRVRVGGTARFEVEISGAVAQGADLHAGDATSIPMYPLGGGRWAAELAGVAAPQTVWVVAAGTRTPWHQLAIDPIPELASVDLTVIAPAYAALPNEQRRGRAGEPLQVEALVNSQLLWKPTANRPLAALVFTPADGSASRRITLTAGQGTTLVGKELTAGSWSVTAEAVDGVLGTAQPLLTLTLREDRPPQAMVLQPERDTIAVAGSVVPLTFSADDDLGLRRVTRISEVGGLGAPLAPVEVRGRGWHWSRPLDLAGIGAVAGDVITVGLVARDSNPALGADGQPGQLSAAATRTIRIISEELYNQELRRRVGAEAVRRKYAALTKELQEIEKTASELRSANPGDPRLAQLAERARRFDQAVAALHRDQPLFAIEPEIQAELRSAAQAVAKAAAEAAAGGDPMKLPQRQRGAALDRDLKQLAELARANALLARLERLADAEQNTAGRLAPLAEHRRLSDADRVRLRELAGDEDQLATAAEEWSTAAAQMIERLGPDHPEEAAQLQALAKAMAAAGIPELKHAAAAAGRSGDGSEARRQADEARDRLLALLPQAGQCRGGLRAGAGMGFSWCHGQGEGLGQALGLGQGQGLGGAGDGGLGMFLAYGGDDRGGTDGSQSQDLIGPENLGDMGGGEHEGEGDAVADLAAGAGGEVRRAPAAYRQQRRATTAAGRAALGTAEQRVVETYFLQLQEGGR